MEFIIYKIDCTSDDGEFNIQYEGISYTLELFEDNTYTNVLETVSSGIIPKEN